MGQFDSAGKEIFSDFPADGRGIDGFSMRLLNLPFVSVSLFRMKE